MNEFPPKVIVVPVDFSPASLAAAEVAKSLARRWGSALELAHVREPDLVAAGAGPEAVPLPLPAPDPDLQRRTRRRLSEAAQGLPPERARIRTLFGRPVREILDLTRESGAGLIVMGTRGSTGLDRILLGSVAEAVVRGSTVPVLTVRANAAPLGAPRILAPWNGRPYATRALRVAASFARSLGAELRVLYVAKDSLSVDESDSRLEKRLDGALGSGGALVWSLRVRAGDAREAIVREANSGRYGLVAVSAHRRPLSSDAVLGSTAQRLLRRSRIPVLSLPARPRQRA